MKQAGFLAIIGLVSGIAMLLLGCASGGSPDAATEAEKIRQDILGRAVMVNNGDVQPLIDAWCEDGIRMAPKKSPIVGKEALAKATKASFAKWSFSDRVHDVQEVRRPDRLVRARRPVHGDFLGPIHRKKALFGKHLRQARRIPEPRADLHARLPGLLLKFIDL